MRAVPQQSEGKSGAVLVLKALDFHWVSQAAAVHGAAGMQRCCRSNARDDILLVLVYVYTHIHIRTYM